MTRGLSTERLSYINYKLYIYNLNLALPRAVLTTCDPGSGFVAHII